MKRFYLTMSMIGTIIPFYIFIPWLIENGLDFKLFVSEWFATRISQFFAADFLISWIVFVIFVVIDARRRKVRKCWIPILGNCLIGLSFALPFYLYQREGR